MKSSNFRDTKLETLKIELMVAKVSTYKSELKLFSGPIWFSRFANEKVSGLNKFRRGLTKGMAHFWTTIVGCKALSDSVSDNFSHVWVRLFLKSLKVSRWSIKVTPIEFKASNQPLSSNRDLLLLNIYNIFIMKSSKQIKITFHKNHVLTYYLIFKFRPFSKITANSIPHYVKTQVVQKCATEWKRFGFWKFLGFTIEFWSFRMFSANFRLF